MATILTVFGSDASADDVLSDPIACDVNGIVEWWRQPPVEGSHLSVVVCDDVHRAVADAVDPLWGIGALGWWGYEVDGTVPASFVIRLYSDDDGVPGALDQEFTVDEVHREIDGDRVFYCTSELFSEAMFALTWIEIAAVGCPAIDWRWAKGDASEWPAEYAGAAHGDTETGVPFWTPLASDMALVVLSICEGPPIYCCRADGSCFQKGCDGACPGDDVWDCAVCKDIVPVEEHTWGSIKTTYR